MKRALIILAWILCFIALVLFVASAALPIWISTPSGTKTVLKWINSQIDGKLTVDKLDLGWFGSQRIENVRWVDETGNLILSFRLLATRTSLLYLALGGRSFGRTVIDEPYLYLSHDSIATFHLTKPKSAQTPSLTLKRTNLNSYPLFAEILFVNNGTVVIAPQKLSPITISQIHIEKQMTDETFQMSAQTIEGTEEGSINVEAHLTPNIQAKIDLLNFPLAIVDNLEGSSFFSHALGPNLSMNLNLTKEGSSSLFISATAKSANLTACIEGTTQDNLFTLSPKSYLDFTLTPPFFKALIHEKARNDWELASKTEVHIQIEKGVFPMKLEAPRFDEIILHAQLNTERAELHHQQLGAYSLKEFKASLIAQHNLEIAYSGAIQGKELTTLTGTLSITPDNQVLFQSDYQGFPVSLLSLVSSNLEKNVTTLFGNQFNMKTQGTYNKEGIIDAQVILDSPLTHFDAHLTGLFPNIDFEVGGSRRIPFAQTKKIGQSVDFTLQGDVNLTANQFYVPFVKGKISNPYMTFDVQGKMGEEGEPFSFAKVKLVATGVIQTLPFLEGEDASALRNTTLYIQVDGVQNHILLKAEGSVGEATIHMRHFIHQDQIAFDQIDATFTTQLREFPVAFIGPLFSDNFSLIPFLGSMLNVKATGSFSPHVEPRFVIDLEAEGSGFGISLACSVDGAFTVQQGRPSFLYWEITPERYQALIQHLRFEKTTEPTFTLTQPTKLELNITQLSCPSTLPSSLSHFLCQSGFTGHIRLGTTIFHSKYANDSIIFKEVSGSVQGANFSEGINLLLKGETQASNVPNIEKSAFAFEGQMLNFWTPEGHFNRSDLTVKGALSLDLLPVRQITGIIPLDDETRAILQAVLGDLMNARIYGEISQLTGPLTIDVKASNFKAKLPLQLQQHTLFLREAVNAEITLTEAVNTTLLKDINPLFLSGARSDHPLTLTIDPQGFQFQLHPYSLQGLWIDRATLDIGKIQVRNGGQVQYLVEFLKAKEITHEGWMSAWFTPIFFNLHHGVASYSRFDALLAGNIHIAMWGNINLINNQVAMTLGIAPSTLRERFKISGLQKQNMFQVKMRGITSKLELDWSAASTRIAFLVAKTAGGHLGALLGGLLEPIITASLGEEPVPPPTTTPFPWDR
jgi:hypothetical protein